MPFQKGYDLYLSKKMTGDQLIILNNKLRHFTDICGACARVKNTPMPLSYSAVINKFIFIYVLNLPFAYVFILGYFGIMVVVFIFYFLASLAFIAKEIEDPFGVDANDLLTKKNAENIKRHAEELI